MPKKTRSEAKIVADKLAGVPDATIAKRYRVPETRVKNIVKQAKKEGSAEVSSGLKAIEWKERLKTKGVDAVEAGLDHDADPYKRADIGVKVLKGLGEFTESVQGLHLLVKNVPRDWVETFTDSDEEGGIFDADNDIQVFPTEASAPASLPPQGDGESNKLPSPSRKE